MRVYIASDVARRHPLGRSFAELLMMLPQWNSLIGGTNLDPVRDFDHVLISGPHMKSASVVVAVVEYNVSTFKIRAALERAMRASRPRGSWQSGYPHPVARFGPDGSHYAALNEEKRLLVVLPAAAKGELARVREMKGFQKSSDDLIVMHIATPWRGVMKTAVPFPKTIAWLRLRLTPHRDSFSLDIEAEDRDAETAERDMHELAAAIEELRPNPIPGATLLGLPPLFQRPTYSRRDRTITAHVEASEVEMRRIIGFIAKWQELTGKGAGKAP
ncbi:MAG: hypothetical protein EXR75_15545 [Myxococcales bacterium]|nr:hypothetical protein [Myxococcales bacterium]